MVFFGIETGAAMGGTARIFYGICVGMWCGDGVEPYDDSQSGDRRCGRYPAGGFVGVWAAGISVSLTVVRPENFLYAVLCGVVGLVIGVIAVRFAEPVTMVMTGLYGAIVLADVVSFFASLEAAWMAPALTAVFAVLGIVAQFLLESRKRKRIHLKKAEEIRQKYSTENEVEKARAMMEALEQESKEEIEE